MDALIFDAQVNFDVEAQPLSRLVYWFERAAAAAAERARRTKKR